MRVSMKEVAGYFVPIDIAHQVLATLGVDTGGVDDNFLELSINDWLADHEKDFFAAIHDRSPKLGMPDVLGVMFITQVVEIVAGAARPKEIENDMKVKKWLVEEGGAPGDKVEWLRFDDVHNMTINGMKPVKTNIRFHFKDREKHMEFRREMAELEKLQATEMEKLDVAELERLRST